MASSCCETSASNCITSGICMSQVVALCAHDPAATLEERSDRGGWAGSAGSSLSRPIAGTNSSTPRGCRRSPRPTDRGRLGEARAAASLGSALRYRLLSGESHASGAAADETRRPHVREAITDVEAVLSSASRQAIHRFDARVPVRENRMHRSMQRREEIGPFGKLVRHRRLPPALPPPASASALVFAPKAGPRRLFRLGEREPRRTAGLAPAMDDHEDWCIAAVGCSSPRLQK